MRTFAAVLTLLCMSGAWAADTATPTATPAPAAGSAMQLGKVEVEGLKPLVEVLQQMKTAIDAPFSNDPKHYDDMVCRLEQHLDSRAQGLLLDCGTQGWFNMRRTAYHRDMLRNPDLTSTPRLGNPWHVLRPLNMEQVAALRQVLGKLPLPGKGDIEIEGEDESTPASAAGTTASP
jgi:hypothetical protein